MKEKINIILKIVIIVAILIIAGSVFYHYVIYFPKQQELKELLRVEQARQEKIDNYKVSFQADCEKKYDELWDKMDEIGVSSALIELLKNEAEERCKRGDYFDIDSVWFCSNGISYVHSRDSFTPACINWKMRQINLY